jgi:hypothetical protein
LSSSVLEASHIYPKGKKELYLRTTLEKKVVLQVTIGVTICKEDATRLLQTEELSLGEMEKMER